MFPKEQPPKRRDENFGIILPARWVSFRSYSPSEEEARSLIVNEKTHTGMILDGISSLVWTHIEGGAHYDELLSLAEHHGVAEEIEDFLVQLANDGLIENHSSSGENEADPSSCFAFPTTAPTPKMFEDSEADGPMREMMDWAMDHGFLFSVHWEITWRCNEKCIHCYNPGAAHLPHEKPERETDELSTKEVFKVLEDLKELGVYRLTISGGEPMLRRDFWEILGRARTLGFAVSIYTNGLKLISDERVERLAALYPSSVSISVYSDDSVAHDSITNVPGSFRKSTDALHRLHELGVPTYLKSIQMSHTVGSYESVQDLAASLGAGPEVDMMMSASADGASAPMALAAQSPEELIVMAVTPGSPIFVGSPEQGFNFIERDVKSSVCGAGVGAMSLDPEGNITPCSSLPIPCGNIREESIVEVWKRSRMHRLSASVQRNGRPIDQSEFDDVLSRWQEITLEDYDECGTHERCIWCSKCPGLAMFEHGDPLGPSTTNCRLATARMFGAGLLEQGETRASLCEKLGVDPGFGRLSVGKVEFADEESVRGTGFSPETSALEALGCGSGCGSCGSSCSPDRSLSFENRGMVILKNGTELTSNALRDFYQALHNRDLDKGTSVIGVPGPVRKIS